MKIKLMSLDDNVEYELIEGNEETVKKLDDAIQAKIDIAIESMFEQVGEEDEKAPVMTNDDQKQVEFAKAVIKAIDKSDVTVDEIKSAMEDQKKYKAQLIDQILKLERLMKVYENDEKVKEAVKLYEQDTISGLMTALEKVKTLFNTTQKGYEFDGFMLKATPALIDVEKQEDETSHSIARKFGSIEL